MISQVPLPLVMISPRDPSARCSQVLAKRVCLELTHTWYLPRADSHTDFSYSTSSLQKTVSLELTSQLPICLELTDCCSGDIWLVIFSSRLSSRLPNAGVWSLTGLSPPTQLLVTGSGHSTTQMLYSGQFYLKLGSKNPKSVATTPVIRL